MTDAMSALQRARRAWEKTQQQQLDLNPDGLDETHAPSPSSHTGGRVRLVEPALTGSGASPTPALTSESNHGMGGSSFRQDARHKDARVPGSRHLRSVPDGTVPVPIPLPRLLEVLPWTS